jgi:hypothetical protein
MIKQENIFMSEKDSKKNSKIFEQRQIKNLCPKIFFRKTKIGSINRF